MVRRLRKCHSLYDINCRRFESFQRRVEELTKENTSLKQENASLKDRLRSLSMCSRCFRPLHSTQEQEDDSSRNASIFQTSPPETTAVSDTRGPSDGQDFTGDDLAEHFSQFSFESMKIKHYGSASTFALANSIAVQACSMHTFLITHQSADQGTDPRTTIIKSSRSPLISAITCAFCSQSWQTRANDFYVFSGSKKRANNSGGMSIRPTT